MPWVGQDDLHSLLINLTERMKAIGQSSTSRRAEPLDSASLESHLSLTFQHPSISTPPTLLGVPGKTSASSAYDRARELIGGPQGPACRQLHDEGQSLCATAQVNRANCVGASRPDQHSGPDCNGSGEGSWKTVIRDRLRDGRSGRAERRIIRWNNRGQLWQRRQDGRTSVAEMSEKNPGGPPRDHSRFVRILHQGRPGGPQGRKLELDEALLRRGSRALRPLQESKKVHLHGRRRTRRVTHRKLREAIGTFMPDLQGVRKCGLEWGWPILGIRDPEGRAQPWWPPAESAAVIAFRRENAALESTKKLLAPPKRQEGGRWYCAGTSSSQGCYQETTRRKGKAKDGDTARVNRPDPTKSPDATVLLFPHEWSGWHAIFNAIPMVRGRSRFTMFLATLVVVPLSQ